MSSFFLDATFLMCLSMVESKLWVSHSSQEGTSPIRLGHYPWLLLVFITSSNLQIWSHLRLSLQHKDLGRYNSVYSSHGTLMSTHLFPKGSKFLNLSTGLEDLERSTTNFVVISDLLYSKMLLLSSQRLIISETLVQKEQILMVAIFLIR